MKLVYPAVFEAEEDGGFYIQFPDVEGAGTQGDDLNDGLEMASDYLGLQLADYIEKDERLPRPSSPKEIEKQYKNDDNKFTTLISVNIDDYVDDGKFVRTTITLPKWVKKRAEVEQLNISSIAAEAIKQVSM